MILVSLRYLDYVIILSGEHIQTLSLSGPEAEPRTSARGGWTKLAYVIALDINLGRIVQYVKNGNKRVAEGLPW